MIHNNLTQEVTILQTWKWEKFEIEMKYEDFLLFEQQAKQRWEDGFNSSKYRRFIKFSSIEDKIWKTKYLALEWPKTEKKLFEMGTIERQKLKKKNPKKYYQLEKEDQERREKAMEAIHYAMEKTEEWRKKRFLERRKKILENLAKEEKKFWLETTLDSVEWHRKIRLQKTIEKFNNS